MAQGHQETGFLFSQEALNTALAARGFRVHDGFAWGEKDGALFPIVAPTSPLAVAHGYAEFLRNRVVSNRNGVSAEIAAIGAADGSAMPGAKSNDAFDSVYQDRIAGLLDASKGWTEASVRKEATEKAASLPANERSKFVDEAVKTWRAERTKLIDLYAFSGKAALENKEKHYDAAVSEAIAAGKAAGVKTESKRKPASVGESEVL